jgi:two-component system sensor histidine kinase BaeS
MSQREIIKKCIVVEDQMAFDLAKVAHLYSKLAIFVEEETIGFLAISKRDQLTAGYELNFVEQQQRYIVFLALRLVLNAMFIAMPLAAHFVEPIKRLTAAMCNLPSRY